MTENVAEVSRAANDAGTAAVQVLDSSRDLSRQASHLNVEVNSFIESVRAV